MAGMRRAGRTSPGPTLPAPVVLLVVEHLRVVFVDHDRAGVNRLGHGYNAGGLVVGHHRHRAVVHQVHELRAEVAHQSRLLGHRALDDAVFDELERAVVAVHGDDLQLADDVQFLGSRRRAHATGSFHAADAGQVRHTLQDSLQSIGGLGGIALLVDDLDHFDAREVLGELVLVALDAFFQVALADLGQDRDLALAADLLGQQLRAHMAGVDVARAQEGQALRAVDFGVQGDDGDARIRSLVDRGLQRRVEADDQDAGRLLGDSLFESVDHGGHVVVNRAHELRLDAQFLACKFQAQAMVDKVRQVGQGQHFDVSLVGAGRGNIDLAEVVRVLRVVEHLGVVFGDDYNAGIHGRGQRDDAGRLVVRHDRHRVVLQPVHQDDAVEGHQRALLGDRALNDAVFDELERAVVAVHGDDLQLADDVQFLGSRRRAHATGSFHAADAGQVRHTLQDSLQSIGGLGGIALLVDDLDHFDAREVLGELVLVALDAFFQVALADLGQDRDLALAADLLGQQLRAHMAGVDVARAQEGQALRAVDFGVQGDDGDARIRSLVDRGLQRRVEADDQDAGRLLGDSLFESVDHGGHVVVNRAHELRLDAQFLACKFQAQAMVDKVRQVGQGQHFDVSLVGAGRGNIDLAEVVRVLRVIEHLGVVFVDDHNAGIYGLGQRDDACRLVVRHDRHRVVLQPVHQDDAVEGHQRALLGDRALNDAVFDELERAVVAVHGDDLQLADDVQFLGSRRRAHATGSFHAADAGQVRHTLQDSLQSIGRLGGIALLVDDLDHFDAREVLGELVLVALDAFFQVALADLGQDRDLALAADLLGQQLRAHMAGVDVARAQEGQALRAVDFGVQGDDGDARIRSLVDRGLQRRVEADDQDAGRLLGDSLFESVDHGGHVVVNRAHELRLDAQFLACKFQAQAMVDKVRQVGQGQHFDVSLVGAGRGNIDLAEVVRVLRVIEHLGVVFVDDHNAGIYGLGQRDDACRLVVRHDRHRVVLQPVHQDGAIEGHQRALLGDRALNDAVFDELERAVVAVHGDDLQLADDVQFLGSRRRAHATGSFHAADAGQVRHTLQDSLQSIGGLGGIALLVDDLDHFDAREVLGELVLVALDAFFQVALADLGQDRDLALAADLLGQQLRAHMAGVDVARAQEGQALRAVDFGVQGDDGDARIRSLVDRGLQRRGEADDQDAGRLLGDSLFESVDHGGHVVVHRAHELRLDAQFLACKFQAQAMVDKVRQVGQGQHFDAV